MEKPMILAVCGKKNSGKTTLITRLVPELKSRGYKVAVIKHDGHDFTCDVPGTDSYKFSQTGAYGIAVFSEHRMFIQRIGTGETEKDLIAMFPEADIILLEGFKDYPYPKIEIVRKGISEAPVSNPENRIAIVTDHSPDTFDETVLDINDIKGIAEFITMGDSPR